MIGENEMTRAAYREELRRIKLEKKRAKFAAELEAKRAKDARKSVQVFTAAETKALQKKADVARIEAENEALLAPLQIQADTEASDTEVRAKVVKAIPWILGAVVAIGAVVMLRRKRGTA